MTGISADDWEKYGSDYFYEQLSDEEKKYWDDLDAICAKYLTTETDAVTTNTGTYRMKAISGSTLEKEKQKKVLRMFRYSKPQYYFLNATIYTITYSDKKVSVIFDSVFCYIYNAGIIRGALSVLRILVFFAQAERAQEKQKYDNCG